jgi:predicted nuclease of predicted toxin-antitoxin system
VKLFLDENLSVHHAQTLRAEGYDVCAATEVGLSGSLDEEVLRFAVAQDRVLLTLDADFANLVRFPPDQTKGIVRLKVHPPTEQAIADVLRRALLLVQNVDLSGRLAVVDRDKVRIR